MKCQDNLKILLTGFKKDVHDDANPFCYTLEDEIVKIHPNVTFYNDVDSFWNDDVYGFNIIHIMWPQVLLCNGRYTAHQIENRIHQLKEANLKIIATCHNLHPHVPQNNDEVESYSILYHNADKIIHLGSYSFTLFKDLYPYSNNVIIPHHVYDSLYSEFPTRKEALKKLHLNPNRKYILCMGAFRNKQERNLVITLSKLLDGTHYYILAPLFVTKPEWRKGLVKAVKCLFRYVQYKLMNRRIICNGVRVPDNLMTSFYSVSEISFLQRLEILNSGNLPMALFMGNVVIGPNIGNVGSLLRETGNVAYTPNVPSSLSSALKTAEKKVEQGMCEYNKTISRKKYNTHVCAEMHYDLYRTLVCSVQIS